MDHFSLENILEIAGEATSPPPDPKKGILKQKFPAFLRWPIRVIFLPFVWIDFAMQRFARKLIKTPFKKKGKCLQRGNCCHYILIRHSNSLFGRLFFFWHTQINGFYPRIDKPQDYEGKKMHVMGCRYLKQDGKCKHYHLRPLFCRTWPVIEHFGYPQVLKGCGYFSDPPIKWEKDENPLHILK